MSLKKQITISSDLLKNSGSSSSKNKSSKEKKKSKVKINKPSKLKKEFLKRIKEHKNKVKGDITSDVAFSSDFKDSMNYLMDIMKDSNTSNRGRTLKHKKSINNPNVNLSIPHELINNEIKISTNVSDNNYNSISPQLVSKSLIPDISPVVTPGVIPVVTPVSTPILSNTPNINNNLAPSPPYGVLKNGNKPTYRTWINKTQKNRDTLNVIPEEDKIKRDEKIDYIKKKFGIFTKPLINSNDDKPKNIKSLIKKKYCTIKRKYKLGKNNTRRKISVLLKNKELRARVQVERSMLRSKPLHVMKNYLYSHGILKVGNNAPKDLIKKIYEDAILTGDVNNTSKDVLIYNYLNKKND